MGDNSQYVVEKKYREVYLKYSQQFNQGRPTLKQMPFGEKVKNKYAKNFIQERRDNTN